MVPVRAGVGHVHLVGEGLADGYWRLRVVRAVEAVLEAQAVPVHRRLEVAAVGDVDGDRRALRHLQGRSGNRAVVGEHAYGGVTDLLLDGEDLEPELLAVSELDELRLSRLGQAVGVARQFGDASVVMRTVVVHR